MRVFLQDGLPYLRDTVYVFHCWKDNWSLGLAKQFIRPKSEKSAWRETYSLSIRMFSYWKKLQENLVHGTLTKNIFILLNILQWLTWLCTYKLKAWQYVKVLNKGIVMCGKMFWSFIDLFIRKFFKIIIKVLDFFNCLYHHRIFSIELHWLQPHIFILSYPLNFSSGSPQSNDASHILPLLIGGICGCIMVIFLGIIAASVSEFCLCVLKA